MAHQGGARAGSGRRRAQRGAHAAGAGSGARQGSSFLTKSLIALGVAGLLGGAAVAANAGLRPGPVQQAVPNATGLGDPALTPSSVPSPSPSPSPTTKPADPPSPGPAAASTGSAPAKTTAPAKVRAPAKPAPPDTANPPVAPNAAG